ncbi:MAG: hypothetical protein BGO01_08090 [Armatimonadetes bacterium 55-13]|nr:hypothetical protein [Armatimonadota bacterium]OJU62433.1 MAG: hypothetical protein BGO01_08090 [Armatimonadetes bacterium 55-13]
MKLRVVIIMVVLSAVAVAQSPIKSAWWVFLVKGEGPRPAADKALEEMQSAHIGNFKRLFGEKKLIAAGPVQDPTQFKRGIVVLTVKDADEVTKCFGPDPYVQGKIMNLEVTAISVDYGRIETKSIDPNAIEEDRLVIFTGESRGDKMAWKFHLAHAKQDGKSAGLSFLASSKDGKNFQAVALFRGKDDEAIQSWIDNDPLVKSGIWKATKIPQWLAKGALPEIP